MLVYGGLGASCAGYLYDCEVKASRYKKGLKYLKNSTTTDQNKILHSQKLRRVLKHTINGNHTTKKKKKKKKGRKEKHIESTGKQGLKWQ